MIFEEYSSLALVILLVSSTGLLLSRSWRIDIVLLSLQYVGVFLLVAVSWPVNLAVVKLVAGWMAGSILGVTRIRDRRKSSDSPTWISERIFHLLAAVLIMIVVLVMAPQVVEWVPNVAVTQVNGALLLIGMGLLHLGLTGHSFRVIVGLLTILSGFEVIYAAVESSTLVSGLLAVTTLGISMAGAYLITAPSMRNIS